MHSVLSLLRPPKTLQAGPLIMTARRKVTVLYNIFLALLFVMIMAFLFAGGLLLGRTHKK